MWKTTGDVKWRERGYAIFQAIKEDTRSQFGYTSERHEKSNKRDVFQITTVAV